MSSSDLSREYRAGFLWRRKMLTHEIPGENGLPSFRPSFLNLLTYLLTSSHQLAFSEVRESSGA